MSLKQHWAWCWRRCLVVLAVVFALDLAVVFWNWPFTEQRRAYSIEKLTKSEVRFGSFEHLFSLRPGFIARNVTITRRAGGSEVTIAQLSSIECHTNWLNLLTFTHRVSSVDLSGVRVSIHTPVPPPTAIPQKKTEETVVDTLTADGALLDLNRKHFAFPILHLSNLGKNRAFNYDVLARIPDPDGQVHATGSLGPFDSGGVGKLPLSGSYDLGNAKLVESDQVTGSLSSTGRFKGTLGNLNVSGEAKVASLHLGESHDAIDVNSEFRVTADCAHGNVAISHATTHFLHTTVETTGSVEDKVLRLHAVSSGARLEDLLDLVVSSDRPPAVGGIQFRTDVTLPNDARSFLHRVALRGSFEIADAKLTAPESQEKLDELSQRSRSHAEKKGTNRKDPPDVAANVQVTFTAADGTARFTRVQMEVPSATARAAGNFNLISKGIALKGTLAMHSSLSGAVGGWKSVLLVPLDPLFKRGKAGAVVPVKVTGTFEHPAFKASLKPPPRHP